MSNLNPEAGNTGFALGTGRCGTHFIARVLELEPEVTVVHERHPFNDTFHRYCKWYDLPVDHEGFLQTKATAIQQDLETHSFSFESSAYLSLSVQELYDRFHAKFILLVRSPDRVVNSYLRKGWYRQPAIRANPNLIPSYQSYLDGHSYSAAHFLGRIMPSGDKFVQWNQMSRVGKLAWYWSALNARVLEQFDRLPKSHWRVEKLEELSHSRYLEIAEFLGFPSRVALEAYNQLVDIRPGAKSDVPTIDSWNATEIAEFETEVAAIAEQLNYEYRVPALC